MEKFLLGVGIGVGTIFLAIKFGNGQSFWPIVVGGVVVGYMVGDFEGAIGAAGGEFAGIAVGLKGL